MNETGLFGEEPILHPSELLGPKNVFAGEKVASISTTLTILLRTLSGKKGRKQHPGWISLL